MKPKYLIVLLVVLVIIAFATWRGIKQHEAQTKIPDVIGSPVAEGLDINAINSVVFLSGPHTTRVAFIREKWKNASLYGYPANYERIRQDIRNVTRSPIIGVIPDGTNYLHEFNLSEDDIQKGDATLVHAYDSEGNELIKMLFGKEKIRIEDEEHEIPEGRFIRINDGPVFLAGDMFYSIVRAAPDEWMLREVMALNADDVARVEVTPAKGTPYTIVQSSDGTFEMLDAKAGEEFDPVMLKNAASAFNYVTVANLASPHTPDSEYGLDQPTRYRATSKDGLTYEAIIGNAYDENTHYIRFTEMKFTPPPEPTIEEVRAELAAAEQTEGPESGEKAVESPEQKIERVYQERMAAYQEKLNELQEKYEKEKNFIIGWNYIMHNYVGQHMLYQRDDLLKK